MPPVPRVERHCPFETVCPIFWAWTHFANVKPFPSDLVSAIRAFDDERRRMLQLRLEWQEPQRSTIEKLTQENAELLAWKRRAELFLLSQGLSLPPD